MKRRQGRSKSTAALTPDEAHFHPGFQDVLRTIVRSSGFVLLPVEVPGPDFGRALAKWLTSAKHPCTIIEPMSDSDWAVLAATVLQSQVASDGVLMVVGTAFQSESQRRGLTALNHQRDAVVNAISRPLLWCGPQVFLDATWEAAPDFWSIRAMGSTLKTILTANELPTDLFDRFDPGQRGPLEKLLRESLAQGDRLNAARIALRLAPLLPPAEADALADSAIGSLSENDERGLRGALHTVQAHAAVRSDNWTRAIRNYRIAHDLAEDKLLRAGLATSISMAQDKLGRFDASSRALQEAITLSSGSGSEIEARARTALAKSLLRNGAIEESIQELQKALEIVRALGDKEGEAELLLHIAASKLTMHDARTALKIAQQGLALAERFALGGTTAAALCQIAMSLATMGSHSASAASLRRATALAKESGDAGLIDYVQSTKEELEFNRSVANTSPPPPKKRPRR